MLLVSKIERRPQRVLLITQEIKLAFANAVEREGGPSLGLPNSFVGFARPSRRSSDYLATLAEPNELFSSYHRLIMADDFGDLSLDTVFTVSYSQHLVSPTLI